MSIADVETGADRPVSLLRGGGDAFVQSRRLLSRSVVLHELPPPGVNRRLVWLIVSLVIGFVVWAGFLELDELAITTGEIAPAEFVQPVQHLEGGIVRSIAVLDGQRVEAGQVLMQLDQAAALAELDSLRARQAALALQGERLKAFALGRALRANGDDYIALREDQTAILASQARSREAQLSVAASQQAERAGQHIALIGRQRALEEQIALLEQDMRTRKPLVDRGIISRLTYLNLERELSRLQGDLAETIGRKEAAQAAIVEARNNAAAIGERLSTEAMRELGEASAQLAEVTERIRQAEDRVERLSIRAPVSGAVTGLAVKSLGAVIAPGAIVAQVVPTSSPLIAEVRVSPRDIGHVKEGLPVTVKVHTYDYTRHGGISGRVDYVSATSFVDDRGQPYFKARLALDSTVVGDPSRNLLISSGMTVSADIKTGSKSLLAYLFKPVSNALQTAFSER